MSVINATPLLAAAGGDYQISRSVRLRSSASAYFNRTPASAGSGKTFTFSWWQKFGTLPNNTTVVEAGVNGTGRTNISFSASGQLQFYDVSSSDRGYVASSAVFRDPSAWYHFVVSIDTTQATAANRVLMYCNGVQLAATITNQIPLNTTTYMDGVYTTRINCLSYSVAGFQDAYLTEMHHIDGQALTPSSFGETDAITGVWKPKKYAGTYGTNGFYLPFTTSTEVQFAGSFNGSSKSLSVASNSVFGYGTGDFTMEGWFYFNDLSQRTLFSNLTTNTSTAPHIYYSATNGVTYYTASADRITGGVLQTANWYHIAVSRNSGSTRLFVNGRQVGSTYTDSNNYGTANPFVIADYGSPLNGTAQFNGLISNMRVVKGTGLYVANFVPPAARLAAISGTSILTLQDSTIVDNSGNSLSITNTGAVATATGNYIFNVTIGSDQSGNVNHWATNNINYSTLGATYDSMIDVPTLYADGGNGRGNYAVMNPLHQSGTATPSFGNLRVTQATNNAQVASTFAMTTGKWYYEHTITAVGGEQSVGIGVAPVSGWIVGGTTGQYGYYSNGNKYIQGTASAYGASYTTGDVIGVAYDADAGSLTFYKNGTSQGVATTGLSGTFFALAATRTAGGTNISDFNFGQRPFSYTPPTGFKALNTQNLPEPTIKKGNQYFDVVTRNGFGTSGGSITSLNFQPNFLWEKARNNAFNHQLVDSSRGLANVLNSNLTNAENSQPTFVTSFNSNGYTLGSNDYGTSVTLVDWLWKESPSAGFDIVTYTGTGSATTVAHNLGVAPKMIICKKRTASPSATNWTTWFTGFAANEYILLDTTQAKQTASTPWNSTLPTSSVFSVGADGGTNASGQGHVAYLFAEVAGFSKAFSYTGNGSADGPFIFCGFRPRWVMIKRTDSTGDWFVFDTARNTFNTMSSFLRPNWSDAEATNTNHSIDLLSNGFKSRAVDTGVNASGGTYIGFAFAESPFRNSLAR